MCSNGCVETIRKRSCSFYSDYRYTACLVFDVPTADVIDYYKSACVIM